MAIVRSLTFFIPIESWSNLSYEDVEKYYYRCMEIADLINIKPWTLRFVLPPLNVDNIDIVHVMQRLYDGLPDRGIMLQGLSLINGKHVLEGVKCLELFDKLYMTVLYSDENLNYILRVFLSDLDPNIYTRISVTYNELIKTPYFPCASNVDNSFGFSIALRYVDLWKEFLSGCDAPLIEYLLTLKNSVERCSSYFLGLDYSISPWMDESIAEVIEARFNVKLGLPGSYNAVYKLNEAIGSLIKKSILRSIGFNEVMLPVGEDNVLKERVLDGTLRLSTLEGLASTCVAGLDMVAIKRNEGLIRSVILDMSSIAKAKRKTIGLRMVPIDGERVHLRRFGEVPVIKL